jgi:hypothetical protein
MSARGAALVVLVVASFPAETLGDGGTLRASQRRGGYVVTVFTAPTPPRAGIVDVSVLVQDGATRQPRPDVPVVVRWYHAGADVPTLTAEATTEAATNKLLRAAPFDVPRAGMWRLEVTVAGHDAEPVICDVDVDEPPPAWLDLAWWVGWPVLAVGLFVIHRRLRNNKTRGMMPRAQVAVHD